jgi:hypothetical protein
VPKRLLEELAMARRLALTLLAVGLLLGLAAPAATAASFTVVQPTDKWAGKTYGQWSAVWWQWIAAIPTPENPVTDLTANCAVHQQGPVWFLAGAAGNHSPSCTVPEGKAILFPVINGECSQVEGNGDTDPVLRACAADLMEHVTETSASVDGTPIPLGSPPDHSRFRFQSPLFQITFADPNPFTSASGTGPSVADGFWVLLKPLREGRHTIDFHGNAPDFGFELTVHYTILVR